MQSPNSPLAPGSQWPFRILCVLVVFLFVLAPVLDWLALPRASWPRATFTDGGRETPPSVISSLRTAPRALVFVTSSFSVPAKLGERQFLAASASLSKACLPVGVDC